MVPVVLTIAGSDPSGGAGLQADLKTFHQHRVYGMSVVTLLTVQSTRGVSRVEMLEPQLVLQQLDAVLEDLPPAAAKVGALGNARLVEAVASRASAFSFPLVVDPVMVSKHGHPLLSDEAVDAFQRLLIPAATLVTPNAPEAQRLTGVVVNSVESAQHAGQRLLALGAKAALIKGGHWGGQAIDVFLDDAKCVILTGERIDSRHTHGTGCTLSAAIAAQLALARPLETAISLAKTFVTEAIASAPGLGSGVGPLNHFATVPLLA